MSLSVPPAVFRAVAASLFIIGGCLLILMSGVGAAPSLWYFFCYCALPIIGIVWLWRPTVAAALSIGPLIAVAALLQYASGMSSFSAWVIVGLAAAAVFVAGTLRRASSWRLPLVVSLSFVTCAFAIDRLFTNNVTVRAHQMQVAVDGHAPWGDVGPEYIVLYRRVGDSYCYDAFRSEDLRQRLASKNGQTVRVEYNIFSDFGRERGYNVRSIDGLLLNNAEHSVRHYEQFGGEVLGNQGTSARTNHNCR
jgi:hypothetical protein